MRRHWLLIVVTVVLAAGAGYGLSLLQPTLYQAEGEVLLSDPRSSGGFAEDFGLVLDPSRYVRNQAQVMKSPQVAAAASEQLGGALTPTEVQEATIATPARDLDTVTITGTQPTAGEAVALVDALVAGYETVVEESILSRVEGSIATLDESRSGLQAEIAGYDAVLDDDPDDAVAQAERDSAVAELVSLNRRIDAISTNASLFGSGVQLYVPPDVPSSPVQPKPLRNAAIAGVLGLIAAGAWAWWRTDRKTHVETREDPAYILEAPLLGVVPRFSSVGVDGPLPALDENQSQASEAYHFVASFVRLALERVGGKSVLITSTGVGDGKTITAVNLVAAAVSDGSYPLLIDADERARGLTRLAGMERSHGITDLTLDDNSDRIIHTWTIGTTEILLVPAGTNLRGGAASYFRSAAFRQALPKLTVGRDLVVIDAPPILAVAETNDLATLVDGVVLVVRPRTPLKELDAARHQLALSGATILGYIYNGATAGTLGYGYGYGYGFSSGYGYGRGADSDAD